MSDPPSGKGTSKEASLSPPAIPDHSLICRIGCGSYGEVWLAQNILGTNRAVKVVYRNAFDNHRPFEREFAGIEKFEPISRSHEGFVDILHLGRNDEAGYFYYVMEIADDRGSRASEVAVDAAGSGPESAPYEPKTLRTELTRLGRLPVTECTRIGLRMAEALAHLHSQGLVHRDLKPSNVIYVNGEPKLADIGLVAGVDEKKSYVGTEGFIPPEGPGTARGDLYGLGKLLYEISTGKDRNDYPELPAEFKDHADRESFAELNEIILKACADDPLLRYQSAEELRGDLAALLEGGSVRERRARERRRTRLRRLALAIASVAIIAAIFGIILVFRSTGTRALSFASRDWVLVTDFTNRTGDPVFEKSLWAAFTVSLQQSQYANIVPRSRTESALRRMGRVSNTEIDEALGREICERENIKALVTCDIAGAGPRYTLSSRLVNPQSGETVKAYQETAATQEGVLEALGSIAYRVREDLGESLGAIRQNDRPLPLVTTRSLDALKSYAEGFQLWRRGAHQQAVRMYESALQRDPNFAMANAALGAAYMSFVLNDLDRSDKGKEYYERALRNAERITDRERLFIQASYARDLGHVEGAVQLFKLYLLVYPDDTAARYSFGTMLMINNRVEEAVEEFKEAIRAVPTYGAAHINLATSYVRLEKPVEALQYYAKAFELEPNLASIANVNDEYGFTLMAAGNLAKAREVFELAASKPDLKAAGLRSLALLDLYEGRYRDAKSRLTESILVSQARQDPQREGRTHVFMSILLDGQGDRAGQLKELGAAERLLGELRELPVPLVMRVGVGYSRAGAAAKADRILRRIRRTVDQQNPQQRSYLHLLEGELALAQKKHELAEEKLLLADRELETGETVASLANAYDTVGNKEQAIEYYTKLIAKRRSPLGWEPQQAWLEAHARLAEVYLLRGENEKAAQMLSPLAQLWKNADPDLPLTKTIARLRGTLLAAGIALQDTNKTSPL